MVAGFLLGIGVVILRLAASAMRVCSMHYRDMAAADFICTTATLRATPSGLAAVSALQSPGWVVRFAVAALVVPALDQVVRHTAELAQAKP